MRRVSWSVACFRRRPNLAASSCQRAVSGYRDPAKWMHELSHQDRRWKESHIPPQTSSPSSHRKTPSVRGSVEDCKRHRAFSVTGSFSSTPGPLFHASLGISKPLLQRSALMIMSPEAQVFEYLIPSCQTVWVGLEGVALLEKVYH